MIKEFLAGLTAPPHPPRIILNKQSGPKQWDIWKLAASTEKLGTSTGHFTGTSCSHSYYFFCYNQPYFIQACVPLHFVIDIENLQFNKTLCSVTCINGKLYTCLNSSLSYSILCNFCSIQSQCLQLGTHQISFTKYIL